MWDQVEEAAGLGAPAIALDVGLRGFKKESSWICELPESHSFMPSCQICFPRLD